MLKNNKIKKVLVSGGAGYIGGAVTDILAKRKIPLTVYDNLLYEHQYMKPVEFIFGDIRDTKKLKKILPNFSHVIWLAAIVGDAACEIKPSLTISVNQDSVKWLSQNFKGRIIFPSTCSVYGKNKEMVAEESRVNPLSLYAKTKLKAEEYLKNKNSLILRLGTVYGISDNFSRLRMDLVVNYMIANALKKGRLTVFGGAQWRPLIHVKDVGEVIVDNMDNQTKGIYNLVTSNYQIKNLAKVISGLIGCKISYSHQEFEDQRNYHTSNQKAIADRVFTLNKFREVADGVKEISNLINSGRVKYTENDIYFNERHIANMHKNGKIT
ncbi:SDR family oxidoreductase [Patescibacteria group bacterium AH-259-L05]|nr:SDR family oxidoreductase [Patescibacteria group bacterium AH-259-L05]